jgi:hypothetical protein
MRIGREYEMEEWLEFLTGSDNQPDYAKETQQKFQDRVEALVEEHLTDQYPDLKEVAYLSYASLAGHGIGLWEEREDWHAAFEKIVKNDKPLNDLFQTLECEVEHGD